MVRCNLTNLVFRLPAEARRLFVRQTAPMWVAVFCLATAWMAPAESVADCPAQLGDVNGDGQTDVIDAQCAILIVLWSINGQNGSAPPCLGSNGPSVTDIDCTNGSNIADVQLIVLLSFGLPLSPVLDSDGDQCPNACEDGTAPVITITSPIDFALFSTKTPVEISGTVVDDSEVTVSVNGTAAVVTGATWTAAGVILGEGGNTITAVATDIAGNVGTATITLLVDTKGPTITIETPPPDTTLSIAEVDVAGMVNDILPGTTVDSDDITVTVNGLAAMVSNRAWALPKLPLQPGDNEIRAVATDAGGNTSETIVHVMVVTEAGQFLKIVSGNPQSAPHGTMVPDPLVVVVQDQKGDAVPNVPVTFEVTRGEGLLSTGGEPERTVTVISDDDGLVNATYIVGDRAGAGNHRVTVTSPGFIGFVEFCFEALATEPEKISADMGNGQIGEVGQPLPMPFVVLVMDSAGNPVENALVTYEVQEGDGTLDGTTSLTVQTNPDGMAAVTLTLGPNEGKTFVSASFPGLLTEPVMFIATAKILGNENATTISGVVLTNQDDPMPNVTVGLKGTSFTAVTDDQGLFTILNAPVGTQHLFVNGTTTTLPGVWPSLEYEMHVLAGHDNTVGMPIYLPTLDTDGKQLAGTSVEVTLHMLGIPGASLTIFPNSVTCPDGSAECEITFSQVNIERVPMPAPLGSLFSLAWTVQPAGTLFDPPAKVCIPNDGRPVGMQIDLFSFDHDVENWVGIGTGTVTPDGTQICSDPGFGINKAGWGGAPPPPAKKKCLGKCGECQECKDGKCVPKNGGGCKDDGKICTHDVCENGQCTHPVNTAFIGKKCQFDGDPDPCKDPLCNASGNCVPTPVNEDGDCEMPLHPCQTGICKGGTCQSLKNKAYGTPCPDDGNPCKSDFCGPPSGQFVPNDNTPYDCVHLPKGAGEKCSDAAYENDCGSWKCNQSGECTPEDPSKEGAPCDADQKFCTRVDGHPDPKNDKCQKGTCVPGPTPTYVGFEIEVNPLAFVSAIIELMKTTTESVPGCKPSFGLTSPEGGTPFKFKKECACCEDLKKIKTCKGSQSFGVGVEAKGTCGFKAPGWQNLVSFVAEIYIKGGISASISFEQDECGPKDKICTTAEGVASLGGQIGLNLGDTSPDPTKPGLVVIGISGVCEGSVGVSYNCCSDGSGDIKANVGKVECKGVATLTKFTNVSFSWPIYPGKDFPFATCPGG
ncbi:MAG: hypothetical protein HUU55_09215 [Myxococcales bacterium]|nr:hypothetical protein [Myxococcales bacterium]